VAFAADRMMDAEVETETGAAKGLRTPLRENQRNGYRERDWDTRVGRITLAIPKLRKGSYFPSFLEPRRMAETALAAVIRVILPRLGGHPCYGFRARRGVSDGEQEAPTFSGVVQASGGGAREDERVARLPRGGRARRARDGSAPLDGALCGAGDGPCAAPRHAGAGPPSPADLAAENARLKRELQRAQMERDMPRKKPQSSSGRPAGDLPVRR
jgi:hypothetical protein